MYPILLGVGTKKKKTRKKSNKKNVDYKYIVYVSVVLLVLSNYLQFPYIIFVYGPI